MATPLGNLEIQLTARMDKLQAELEKTNSALTRWGKKLETSMAGIAGRIGSAFLKVGSIIGGAFLSLKFFKRLDDAAEKVDQIGKVSKRLGLAVEMTSALRFAAGEAGQDFETWAKSVSKLGKNIGDLVAGGKESSRVGKLLVNFKDTNGQVRSLAELLPEIARGIESVDSQAEQLSLASKFFGKEGGAQFVTLLKDGGTFAQNLAVQFERARRLGVIFTPEQVEQLTAYRDAIGRVQEAWFGLQVKLATVVMPRLTSLINGLASTIAAIPDILQRLSAVFDDSSEGDRVRGNLIEFFTEVWYTVAAIFKRLMQEALVSLASGMIATFNVIKTMALGGSAGDLMKNFWKDQQKFRELIGEPTDFKGWTAEIAQHGLAAWHALDRAGRISESVAAHGMDIAAESAGDLAKNLEGVDFWATETGKHLIEFGDSAGDAIRNLSKDVSDEFAEMSLSGKASFGQIARDFGKMLLSMFYQKMVFGPLFNTIGTGVAGLFGPSTTSTGPGADVQIPDIVGGPYHGRNGGILARWGFRRYATGIGSVPGPNVFDDVIPTMLMPGEGVATRSAVRRNPGVIDFMNRGGILGGGGGVVVQLIDQRGSGARPEVSQSRGPDGRQVLQILIRDEVNGGLATGAFDRTLNQNFGINRQPVRR